MTQKGYRGDLAAIGILLLGTLLFFSPALWRGLSYGPFDLLAIYPIGKGLPTHIQQYLNADQIALMNPLFYLNWKSIHSGQFPLWNSFTLLGLPQFFDFQSSVLSLPNLVSYLFPVSKAYLVLVIVKQLIAGIGAYVFMRVIKMRIPAAVYAGLTFELSGALVGWAGWPLSGVNAWLGWIFAFCYLLYSRKNWHLYVPLLAVVLAFTIYAGHPESYVLIALTMLLFFLWIIAGDLITNRTTLRKNIAYFVLSVTAAIILAFCLSAPLLLPGAQLISLSSKPVTIYNTLPFTSMVNTLFQGFCGYPTTNSQWFGAANYYETAAYVGVLAVMLAITAVLGNRKRREVTACAFATVILLAVVYWKPAAHLINAIPHLGIIAFTRSLMPIDFLLAVLSGIGLNHVIETWQTGKFGRPLAAAYGTIAVVILGVFYFGLHRAGLTPEEALIRYKSFVWPAVFMILVPGAFIIFLQRQSIYKVTAIGIIILAQLLYLLTPAPIINSYSHRYFPSSPQMSEISDIVGNNVLGTINEGPPTTNTNLGFFPETNIAYGVTQFAAYDPILPTGYLDSYKEFTHREFGSSVTGTFSPSIDSVSIAKAYGIRYVLAPSQTLLLSPHIMGAIQKDLMAGKVYSARNEVALLQLLRIYQSREDLQLAFPSSKPNFVSQLLDWSVSTADSSSNVLAPYLSSLEQIRGYVNTTPLALVNLKAEIQVEQLPGGLRGAKSIYTVDSYQLVEIPGAARFTIENNHNGRIISSSMPNNYTYLVNVHTAKPASMIVRVTNVPGWHAIVNGKSVKLTAWHDIMQKLQVPAGTSLVKIYYWPKYFTYGVWLGILGFVAISIILAWEVRIRRLRSTPQ